MRVAWVLLAVGCGKKIDDVAFVPGAIAGTGTVTFSSKRDGEAHVAYGPVDGDLTGMSASVPAESGEIPLLGLSAGAYDIAVVITDGNKKKTSKTIEINIPQPDPQVPALRVDVWEPDLACDPGGHVLFSFLGADSSGVAIVNRDGDYVWSLGSDDPSEQIARARPSRDGKSLIWNYADINKVEDIAQIVRMSMDGSELTETRTLQAHHDFVELPDGQMAFLAYEFRDQWAPAEETGPTLTDPAKLVDIFGEHPWQAAGVDLSVIAAGEGKESIEIVLNKVGDTNTFTMTTVSGGESTETSGTFILDVAVLPWGITLEQTTPVAATMQGLIEVHTTAIRLELAQTTPDIGLLPPTSESGLGSTSGPGYNTGDNILTFRRQVSVAADAIYEVAEGTTETGSETIVWSAFDDYPQGIYRLPIDGFAGAFLPNDFEFGHGNSLGYVESTDSYFMNWRWLDTLLKIERNGTLTWQWGGPYNDLTGDPAALVEHSHFSDVWDGGILMFDNRNRDINSRLVEYTFDDSSYEQVWEYQEPEPKFEALLGDVRRIPIDGCDNVLVSWSGQGKIQEITREGKVVWEIGASSIGNITSRVHFLPDLYDMSGVAYP